MLKLKVDNYQYHYQYEYLKVVRIRIGCSPTGTDSYALNLVVSISSHFV